ncbi:MAG: glycosyl transferase [Clostridia bacterium]|nr:glycosyl transferase [Clostridia bacterium]
MIKKIHYVWIGNNPKPEKVVKCIESWRKKCPDYEIIEWNESNYDINKCKYARLAYEDKKYAFVSDFMRFDILNKYGGIYVDTDVEILKDITPLLHSNFMGFERAGEVAPGLIMYTTTNNDILKEILDYYYSFNEDKINYDYTVCNLVTDILLKRGLTKEDSLQRVDDFTIYPTEYFNPKGANYGKEKITNNTYCIHHYLATWKSKEEQKLMEYKVKYGVKKGKILFILAHPILSIKIKRKK